jgi:hypothetical protein
MAYAWLIYRDDLAVEGSPAPSPDNAAGTMGPSDAPEALVGRLHAGDGHPFRLYDDDGDLYYSGRIVFDPPTSVTALGNAAFGPLDDFGGPNAGCTEIRYRYPNGSWRAL